MKDFINFCETLSPKQWNINVSVPWTIRDVIVHMVGWEKTSYLALVKVKRTKKSLNQPTKEECDRKNKKFSVQYVNYSNNDLIKEWKHWREKINQFVEENDMRSELFAWFFDNHKDYHFNQVKSIIFKTPV